MNTLPVAFVYRGPNGSARLAVAIGDYVDDPSPLHTIGTCQMLEHEPVVESFQPSRDFAEFLYLAIAEIGPTSPALNEHARALDSGEVAIRDLRSSAEELVPRDVFGTFRVMDGCVQPGSFWRNPEHALFTEDGVFCLPEELYAELLELLAPMLRGDA